MNVPERCVDTIKDINTRPTFRVETEGKASEWTRQTTGIRQGCPLSPYLFLMLMTYLFHDVHENDKVDMIQYRVEGAEEDKVLYADDTMHLARRESHSQTTGGNRKRRSKIRTEAKQDQVRIPASRSRR